MIEPMQERKQMIEPMHYLDDALNLIDDANDPDAWRPPPVNDVLAAALTLKKELESVSRKLEWARASMRCMFDKHQTPGAVLRLGEDAGGLRHFLDGKPVSAGAVLYLLTNEGWLGGRYEWEFTETARATFTFYIPGARSAWGGQVTIVLPPHALLAFPSDLSRRG